MIHFTKDPLTAVVFPVSWLDFLWVGGSVAIETFWQVKNEDKSCHVVYVCLCS